MMPKVEYLKVKLILGSVTLLVGLVAATIALFQWGERTGTQHLLGEYSRYALGFGGFAAMILGAMLFNDAYVLRDFLNKHPQFLQALYLKEDNEIVVPKRKRAKARRKND